MTATTNTTIRAAGRHDDAQAGTRAGTVSVWLRGKPVSVEFSAAAAAAMAKRSQPLVIELELYFSCLVKKFAHVHETMPERLAGRDTVPVGDALQLCFRVVTSTGCSMDEAERLGRQPEVDIDTPAARKLAPRRVAIDHRRGQWRVEYWV